MKSFYTLAAIVAVGILPFSASAHFGVDHTGADHSHVADMHDENDGHDHVHSTDAPAKPAGTCEKPGVVSLAGEVILRIHAPAGGKDCQQRADTVTMRITDALSIGLVYPKDIVVKKIKGEWAVLVKDILIITADKTSAQINKTNPKALAEIWAKNLRRTIPESTPQKPGVHGPAVN